MGVLLLGGLFRQQVGPMGTNAGMPGPPRVAHVRTAHLSSPLSLLLLFNNHSVINTYEVAVSTARSVKCLPSGEALVQEEPATPRLQPRQEHKGSLLPAQPDDRGFLNAPYCLLCPRSLLPPPPPPGAAICLVLLTQRGNRGAPGVCPLSCRADLPTCVRSPGFHLLAPRR